jgi:hypothetical protein
MISSILLVVDTATTLQVYSSFAGLAATRQKDPTSGLFHWKVRSAKKSPSERLNAGTTGN